AIITQAVLRPVGVVGVSGTKPVSDLGIVLCTCIDIVDQKRNRRAGRDLAIRLIVLKDAGNDTYEVRLLALADIFRLSRTPAIKIGLYLRFDEWNAGRTAVDNTADRRPVALAKGGDAEEMAEAVVAHPPADFAATEMSGASSAFMPTM